MSRRFGLPACLGIGILLSAFLILPAPGFAHSGDQITSAAALLEARQQFRQDRFGLLIHWGLFSTLADGESVMEERRIPIPKYEKLAATFNPSAFQAAEWVRIARSAGARYITFTAKHRDGFALWNSEASDWNIVKRTPFARDVVRELADECHRTGTKLFLYYSHLDWHHADYIPRGRTGHAAGRPDAGNWSAYLDTVDAQLRELLTSYGSIHGLWFDGWWDRPHADWRFDQTFRLVRSLQPTTLLATNRRPRPHPDEDFMTYERFLPGEDLDGFTLESELGDMPLETCDSMNDSWGYRKSDTNYKSARQLVHALTRAAGADANFLLGIGPDQNGRIPPEVAERIRQVGRWLDLYGQTIYGTRGGPLPPQPWGALTRRDHKIYVHVLDKATTSLPLSLPSHRVLAARTLDEDETDVPFRDTGGTVTLTLPPERPREFSRVVVLYTEERAAGKE